MSHVEEDTLILYYYGESEDQESVERHLRACTRCRGELDALVRDLADIGSIAAPERGEDYGARVWDAIAPRLRRHPPRRGWLVAAAALLVAGTFLVGRWSIRGTESPGIDVRESILLVALDEHLSRSEVLLLEVVNADESDLGRRAARELVRESRLYRQTARRVGDVATAETLDELERLLLDVSHGATPAETLESRIEEQDLLFKIRVLQASIEAREQKLAPTKF